MTAVGKLGDEARPVRRGGRLRHPQGRHREHGGGRAHPSGREGQGPARATRWSASAAPGPAHAAGVARVLGVARGDHSAGLGRRLGARLPRRAAVLRARALAIRCASRRASTRRRSTAFLAELEAEGRALLAEAGIAGAQVVGRAHAPTCGSSARCTRSTCRCRRARSARHRSARSARPSPTSIRARYTSVYGEAAHRGDQLPRALLGPGARTVAEPGGRRAATPQQAQGHAPGLVRRRLRRGAGLRPLRARARRPHRRPGDHRGARGDHGRSARRQPAVDDNLNLRIAIGVAAPPQALVAPGTPLAEAMARIEADPIALEIMWSRLVTVVEEMWLTVLPHGLLADHLGGAGFRLRAARRRGRAAGAFAARHAGVQSHPAARREGAAGEISRPRR